MAAMAEKVLQMAPGRALSATHPEHACAVSLWTPEAAGGDLR